MGVLRVCILFPIMGSGGFEYLLRGCTFLLQIRLVEEAKEDPGWVGKEEVAWEDLQGSRTPSTPSPPSLPGPRWVPLARDNRNPVSGDASLIFHAYPKDYPGLEVYRD
jgi:hypothetical protein